MGAAAQEQASPKVKVLLDTHVWIWSNLDPRRLGRRITRVLEDARAEHWLSPISVWEFIDLSRKGRFRPLRDPFPWVEEALAQNPMREAALTTEIALEAGRFEMLHKDPADQLIVATARVLGLTLITADQEIIAAGVVPVLETD